MFHVHDEESTLRTVARVAIEDRASPDEVEAVGRLFGEQGLQVDVRASFGRKALDPQPWGINFVEIGLAAFLGAFAKDLYAGGKQAAGRALKAFLRRLSSARTERREGSDAIWLQDRERRLDIYFSGDSPNDALADLFDIDIDRLRGGDTIRYDRDKGAWWVQVSSGLGGMSPAPMRDDSPDEDRR